VHRLCIDNGSFNNLPCYPSDSHQSQNAVYWRTGSATRLTRAPRLPLGGLRPKPTFPALLDLQRDARRRRTRRNEHGTNGAAISRWRRRLLAWLLARHLESITPHCTVWCTTRSLGSVSISLRGRPGIVRAESAGRDRTDSRQQAGRQTDGRVGRRGLRQLAVAALRYNVIMYFAVYTDIASSEWCGRVHSVRIRVRWVRRYKY